MTKNDNGGPAFPQHMFTPYSGGGGVWTTKGGMTLRDWFAGQALAGLLAYGIGQSGPADVAWAAYQASDAMLEARK